ncbi:hypothetical protein F5Y11DRAFT_348637 [Daldinia sp. FL1419]|nr:hypothetical protein F5Y11DRAFT_348637 [Daldinia sp. FL1419]
MATIHESSEPLTESATGAVPYTRLHIAPLDESLLNVVVPSSVLPRARNISYHIIETFPEKRYGFVDLPTADADKIKRKLNGAVLKGTKMRIEKARPESIPEPTGVAGDDDAKKEKKKKQKKRKREIDTTPGVELEGRKVKRGWTRSEREMVEEKRKKSNKDKKSKEDREERKKKKKRESKSKYTDGPECLFKTRLPDISLSKEDQDHEGVKRKKRKGSREVVLHEFEKTIKHPSFLKSSAEKLSSGAVTFKDGIGWVDEHGAVVEPVLSKRQRADSSKLTAEARPENPVVKDDTTSSSGLSSSDSDDSGDSNGSDESDIEASNGAVDSPDEDEEQAEPQTQPMKLKLDARVSTSPVSILKTGSARPKSSGSTTSLTIKIPPATPASAKVHPLEALYKRPQGGSAAPGQASGEAQPFSFFDEDNDDIDEDEGGVAPVSQAPMTPFTKQDFEFRNLRSAAPTPDTAHPSRTFNPWPGQDSADDIAEDDEEQEQEENNENSGASGRANPVDGDDQTPISDFQRQFWESRGDLNRSWRKRRKAVSKEKRYRENRARAERAI